MEEVSDELSSSHESNGDVEAVVVETDQESSSSSSLELPSVGWWTRLVNKVMLLLRLRHIGPSIEAAVLLGFVILTILIVAYCSLLPALAKPFTEISGAEKITAFVNCLIGICVWATAFGFWIIVGRDEIKPPSIYSNQNNAIFSLLNMLYGFVRLALFLGLLAVDELWATTTAFSLELYCGIIAGIIWLVISARRLIHMCKADMAKLKSTK